MFLRWNRSNVDIFLSLIRNFGAIIYEIDFLSVAYENFNFLIGVFFTALLIWCCSPTSPSRFLHPGSIKPFHIPSLQQIANLEEKIILKKSVFWFESKQCFHLKFILIPYLEIVKIFLEIFKFHKEFAVTEHFDIHMDNT